MRKARLWPGFFVSGRRVGLFAVNRLDGVQQFVAQLQAEAAEVALQLLQAGGADDIACDEGLAGDEGQGHLCRVQAMLPGQRYVAAAGGNGLRVGVTGEAAEQGDARIGRACAVLVFAREHAEGQRRVGQQAALFAHGNFGQADLEAAVEQVVGVLDRDRARQAQLVGQLQVLHGAPGRLVGQADVANLPGLDLFAQHFQGFLQRGEVLFLVAIAELAEEVGADGFVYGIDISDGMLDKARANAEKFGIANVKFIPCELEKLDLPDKTAHLVISNCTINHAADKQAVWNEVFRILKKGGRFVVSDIYSTEPIDEMYRNDPQAVAECWAGAVTREEYMKTLAHAGFSTIKILEESAPYPKGKTTVCSFTIAGKKPSGCNCGL